VIGQVVNVNPGFHATAIHSNGYPSFRNNYLKQPAEVRERYGDKFINDCEKVGRLWLYYFMW